MRQIKHQSLICSFPFVLLFMNNKNNLLRFKVKKQRHKIYTKQEEKQNNIPDAVVRNLQFARDFKGG